MWPSQSKKESAGAHGEYLLVLHDSCRAVRFFPIFHSEIIRLHSFLNRPASNESADRVEYEWLDVFYHSVKNYSIFYDMYFN